MGATGGRVSCRGVRGGAVRGMTRGRVGCNTMGRRVGCGAVRGREIMGSVRRKAG